MAAQPVILNERYRIERKLGKGAMGDVYLAIDMREDEPVAIKTINRELYQNQEVRERFTREVAALRKLDHPYIIGYVDAFAVKGRACLVMEYVAGGNLADLIKDRSPLDLGFFKNIAAKVIDAVGTAHLAGILHRDLKPANILMNAVLEPKVADFGLAKMTDLTTLTATGTAMGTLAYMPPEAFDMLSKPDERSDIWALGVIFFEMLTGTLPFPAKTQPQMIGAILNDEPFDITMYRRDVPVGWQLMIAQCLQKKPQERYQRVEDMIPDLNEVSRAHQDAHNMRFLPDENEVGFGDLFDFENNASDLADDSMRIDIEEIGVDRPQQAMSRPRKSPNANQLGHAAAPDYGAKARAKKQTPMAALLFSGLLLWLGVAASFVGGGLIVYSFTDAGTDFVENLETAQALTLVGSLMFAGGVAVEAVTIRPERGLELGVLVAGVVGIWFVFFSEILLTGFLAAMLGIVFYIVAVVMYFQTQRT
jgi:serine/threonine protein kinase